MKNNRRDFLKWTGLAGLGLAGSSLMNSFAAMPDYQKSQKQRFNMSGFAASKIGKVRIGIIGLGNRGPSHLETMRMIEGVEIRALCDLLPERVAAAKKRLDGSIHNPTLYSGDKDAWMKLCEQEDIDLVMITTPY